MEVIPGSYHHTVVILLLDRIEAPRSLCHAGYVSEVWTLRIFCRARAVLTNPRSAFSQSRDGRALAYQRHAKDMILQMADEESRDLEPIPVNQEIPLWKEARLVMLSKYLDGDLVGEKYRLTNVSDTDMLLMEQELYRKGVVAVVIENHTLPSKGQTLIFIVRGRKDNE